jgi:TonB family protein
MPPHPADALRLDLLAPVSVIETPDTEFPREARDRFWILALSIAVAVGGAAVTARRAAQRLPEPVAAMSDIQSRYGEWIRTQHADSAPARATRPVHLALAPAHRTPRRPSSQSEVLSATSTPLSPIDARGATAVIERNRRKLDSCYGAALDRHPDLTGEVDVEFRVASMGSVAHATVARSTVKDDRFERCILARVAKWTFPKPVEGTIAFTYPFKFDPGDDVLPYSLRAGSIALG